MIENDLEWFEIVILILEKKGVYPITKYHTFFPRPIFDTKTIENDLQSGAPLAWVRWVPWNPSIFKEGFSNPSIFWKIQ